jgi:hypothetical protein
MLAGDFCAITFFTHHIQNDRMVNHAIILANIYRGHRIFENALPFGKDQIGG